MPAILKVLLQMTILVGVNSVMGKDETEARKRPSFTQDRGESEEPHYGRPYKITDTNLIHETYSSKEERGSNKRDFKISQGKDSNLKLKRELVEKIGQGKSGMGSKDVNTDYDLHADMERLQAQITKTTMEINQLYGSYGDEKSDDIKHRTYDKIVNATEGNKPTNKASQALCNEKTGKYCREPVDVKDLRNKLTLERSVRNQMIRILAQEKLRNESKSKALQALLRYYHPDQGVLRQLKLPSRLKRVILVERLKLLPVAKQVEFARRARKLKEKIRHL